MQLNFYLDLFRFYGWVALFWLINSLHESCRLLAARWCIVIGFGQMVGKLYSQLWRRGLFEIIDYLLRWLWFPRNVLQASIHLTILSDGTGASILRTRRLWLCEASCNIDIAIWSRIIYYHDPFIKLVDWSLWIAHLWHTFWYRRDDTLNDSG